MACINHPEVAEVTRCDECRRPCCDDCYVLVAGRALCGRCKDEAVRRLQRGGMLSDNERGPSPWERKASFANFRATLSQSMLRPNEFFARLQHQGSASYMGYAVLVAWPSTFIAQMTGILLQAALMAAASGGKPEGIAVGLGMLLVMGVLYFVLTPITILMQVVMGGGLTHLSLKLIGGANAPFEATLRVAAYAQSPQILAFVPILGPLAGWGWGLVLQIVGVKEMHETDWGRAVLAVFLPGLVCCVLLLPIIVLIGVMAALDK